MGHYLLVCVWAANRLLMLSLPVEENLHFVQDDVKGVGFPEQTMAAICESALSRATVSHLDHWPSGGDETDVGISRFRVQGMGPTSWLALIA